MFYDYRIPICNVFLKESIVIFLAESIVASLGAYLIYFVHIIVHESGHLVFGLLTGYRFSSFRILKFMWQKDDDGKIRYYNYNLAGTGGQCIMEPPGYKEDGKNPYVLYNIGGIVFNLILAAICGICYILFQDTSDIAKFIFLVFVVIGVFIALINGIPLKEISNDGSNIYELSKSGEAVRAFYIQMMGISFLKKGIRIKDFPEEWFVMPSDEDLKNYICAVRAVYICDRFFDEGEYGKADEVIDNLLEKDIALLDVYRQMLKANAIYCAALKKDRVKADQYLDDEYKKFMKTMQTNPAVIRSQYAYELLINDDEKEAVKKLEFFDKIADKYPYQIEIEAEREAIAHVKDVY